MKAFRFSLEQALRWRATQTALEKSRVAAAAKRVTDIRSQLEALRAELQCGAGQVAAGADGSALAAWAAYSSRALRTIEELEKKAVEAGRAFTAALQLLAQAGQKEQLLENLREVQFSKWRAEFDREVEAFAGEAFLVRLQSKSGKGA